VIRGFYAVLGHLQVWLGSSREVVLVWCKRRCAVAEQRAAFRFLGGWEVCGRDVLLAGRGAVVDVAVLQLNISIVVFIYILRRPNAAGRALYSSSASTSHFLALCLPLLLHYATATATAPTTSPRFPLQSFLKRHPRLGPSCCASYAFTFSPRCRRAGRLCPLAQRRPVPPPATGTPYLIPLLRARARHRAESVCKKDSR
jgi:hypothetical protein